MPVGSLRDDDRRWAGKLEVELERHRKAMGLQGGAQQLMEQQQDLLELAFCVFSVLEQSGLHFDRIQSLIS